MDAPFIIWLIALANPDPMEQLFPAVNISNGDEIMDIPMNVDVFCSDHRCGASTHLVLNPTTGLVTHLVVKEDTAPYAERLVPIKWVTAISDELVRLRCTRGQVAGMKAMEG